MTTKMDVILEFMAENSCSYSIKDISITLNIPVNECEHIVNFLSKYNFIEAKGEEYQINSEIRDLILENYYETNIPLTIS